MADRFLTPVQQEAAVLIDLVTRFVALAETYSPGALRAAEEVLRCEAGCKTEHGMESAPRFLRAAADLLDDQL